MQTRLAVGVEVAGYRIESFVARGGMAVVYCARDLQLDRQVALKLLAPELAESESFRARFLRESRLAASMDHPNIIPIYSAGMAEDLLYLAMRFVEGRDLRALLAQEGPLPLERARLLLGQVGQALDAAHAAGLVHRDVKPANVLVGWPGADGVEHVYLSDFGLTKRSTSMSGLTATGFVIGTIDYIAPEQVTGKPVDARTDIYALGCVLFEVLTGRPPFQRDHETSLMQAHVFDSVPRVTSIRPDLPARIDEVVATAMAKDPVDRYASAADLAAELDLLLPGSRSLPGAEETRLRVVAPRSPAAVSGPGVTGAPAVLGVPPVPGAPSAPGAAVPVDSEATQLRRVSGAPAASARPGASAASGAPVTAPRTAPARASSSGAAPSAPSFDPVSASPAPSWPVQGSPTQAPVISPPGRRESGSAVLRRPMAVLEPLRSRRWPTVRPEQRVVWLATAALSVVAVVAAVVVLLPSPAVAVLPFRFAPEHYCEAGVQVRRQWRFSEEDAGRLDGELVVGAIDPASTPCPAQALGTRAVGPGQPFDLDEVLPKSLVDTVSKVTFEPAYTRVVREDPVVRYRITDLERSRTLTYSVGVAADSRTLTQLRSWAKSQQREAQAYWSERGTAPVTLGSLVVEPAALSLTVGDEPVRLSVRGTDAAGAAADEVLLDGVEFTSTRPEVVSVDPAGRVRAVGPGEALITTSLRGLQDTTTVTVTSPTTTTEPPPPPPPPPTTEPPPPPPTSEPPPPSEPPTSEPPETEAPLTPEPCVEPAELIDGRCEEPGSLVR